MAIVNIDKEGLNPLNQLLIIPHIPKTGGCSFSSFLKELSKIDSKISVIYDNTRVKSQGLFSRDIVPPTIKKQIIDDLYFNPQVNQVIIFGHLFLDGYFNDFPGIEQAIWLRNPHDRVISAYQYILRETDEQSSFFERVIQKTPVSIEEYIRACGNTQTSYIAPIDINKVAFIGITEYFEKSLELFKKIFKIETLPTYQTLNANPNKKSLNYETTPEIHELITRHNQHDIELYKRGLDRFNELCQEYNIN